MILKFKTVFQLQESASGGRRS